MVKQQMHLLCDINSNQSIFYQNIEQKVPQFQKFIYICNLIQIFNTMRKNVGFFIFQTNYKNFKEFINISIYSSTPNMVKEIQTHELFKNTLNPLQTYSVKLWLANKLPQSSSNDNSMLAYASLNHNINNHNSLANRSKLNNLLVPNSPGRKGKGKSFQKDHIDDKNVTQSKNNTSNVFPLQVSSVFLAVRASVYALEALSVFIILIVSCFRTIPIFSLNSNNINQNYEFNLSIHILIITIFVITRLISTLFYIIFHQYRTTYHYAINKFIQTFSLILFRVTPSINTEELSGFAYSLGNGLPVIYFATTLVQYFGDVVYIMCKEQRYGYFDSRLYYVYYVIRIIVKSICLLIFNMRGEDAILNKNADLNMLIFIVLCASVQCYCISKQTFYSQMTRNLLFIMWFILLINAVLVFLSQFFCVFHVFNNLQKPDINFLHYIILYSTSLILMVIAWLSRYYIALYPLSQFTILCQNFNNLSSQEQKIKYIWSGIRLISMGYQNLYLISDTVTQINWAINKYCDDVNCKNYQFSRTYGNNENNKQMSIIRRKKLGQYRRGLYMDFYEKFVHHCYVTMLRTFKQIEQIKYLLIFFFNEKSAEKMMLYLNQKNFYDIREHERIKKQHRSSDLAAKINQMQNNEIQISNVVKQYLKKQKKLIELIYDSSTGINLDTCKEVGQQIIYLQQKILTYGSKIGNNIQNHKHGNASKPLEQSPKILSEYSRHLLNLIRKQLLNLPDIFTNKNHFSRSQDEYIISEIMNQQESLVLISAQHETVGKIVAINPAASKLTYFLESELVGQNVNVILPEQVHVAHSNILNERAGVQKSSEKDFMLKNLVYVVKKNKYCSLCNLSVRFIDGTMGRRWLAKLTEIESFTPFIICDNLNKMIGFNESANMLGINFNWLNVEFTKQLRQKLQIFSREQLSQDLATTKTVQKAKPAILTFKEFIDMSDYQQKRYKKSSKNIGEEEKQSKGKSFKLIDNQKGRIEQQQLNNLLEISLICQVNKIGNTQIIGFYIIKIVLLNQSIHKQLLNINYRKPNKLSEYASQCKNKKAEEVLISIEKSLQSIKQDEPASIKKRARRSNSIRFRLQDNFTQQKQTQFAFFYNPTLHCITNENRKKKQWGEEEVNEVYSEVNPIESQYQLSRSKQGQIEFEIIENKEEPSSSDKQNGIANNYKQKAKTYKNKIWGAEDINQLIYINGELQFRENKKLEERYQCDTHPLHLYHQAHGQLTQQELKFRQISSKDKIYEILQFGNPAHQCGYLTNLKKEINTLDDQPKGDSKWDKRSENQGEGEKKISKKHKLLICILGIFCTLIVAVSIIEMVEIKQINKIQRKKIESLLLNSEQLMYYNQLSNYLNNYIVSNLNNLLIALQTNTDDSINSINGNIVDWKVSQLLGSPSTWYDILKEIEIKNSLLSDIDTIYNKQQMHKIYQVYIPSLDTADDLSQLSNNLLLDVQELEKLCSQYPNITIQTGKTRNTTSTGVAKDYKYVDIRDKILAKSMSIHSSLVSRITPIKIFMISEISQKYNTEIDQKSKILYICLSIMAFITLVLSLISVCWVRQLQSEHNQNMEIFSFFPFEILQDFLYKLNVMENKISNDQDISSEIGIEEMSVSDQNQMRDNLLFHKKKIQKNNKYINIAPILTFLSFILVASPFCYVFFSAIHEANNSCMVENWFFISSMRIIEYNYKWQQIVVEKGINELQPIQSYFKSQIFHKININDLLKTADQTQRYKRFLVNYKQNKFSTQFQNEKSQQLDENYCQISYITNNTNQQMKCDSFVGGISVQDFEAYLQIKQYGLDTLFELSFRQKNGQMYEALSKYFDNYSRKQNQKRLMRINRVMIEKQMEHRQKIIEINMYIGFVIGLIVLIGYCVGFVWCVYKSRQFIIRPIFVLVRCFPLIALNRNESFLDWYHRKRNKQLR